MEASASQTGISFTKPSITISKKAILQSLGFGIFFQCNVASSVPEGKYPIYLKSSTQSGRIYYDTTQISVICLNPISSKPQKMIGTTTCTSGFSRKDTAYIYSEKIPNSDDFDFKINFETYFPQSYYADTTVINGVNQYNFYGKIQRSTSNNSLSYSCLKAGDKFGPFGTNYYGSSFYPLQVSPSYEEEFIYDTISTLKLKFILYRKQGNDTCTFIGSY